MKNAVFTYWLNNDNSKQQQHNDNHEKSKWLTELQYAI